MSQEGKYGVGPSSHDHGFGSGGEKQTQVSSATTAVVSAAPLNDDNKHNSSRKPPKSPSNRTYVSNNYHRPQGQNLGNFITDRPTTKVKSPPGGESSIGYLCDGK